MPSAPRAFESIADEALSFSYWRKRIESRDSDSAASTAYPTRPTASPRTSILAPIMNLAPRSERLIAQMLDAVVAFIPFLGLVVVAAVAPGQSEPVVDLFALPTMLFLLGYIIFADALPRGQSVGKRAMGIAVVDRRTGRPCSAWQSFVRNVLLAILGVIDWIFIFGSMRQRLGDKAAGTIVVELAPARAYGTIYQ